MSPVVETLSGVMVGLGLAVMGAAIGFSPPTEAEAVADPRTLRWGRRPAIRRRLGLVIIVMGVLAAGLRVASEVM